MFKEIIIAIIVGSFSIVGSLLGIRSARRKLQKDIRKSVRQKDEPIIGTEKPASTGEVKIIRRDSSKVYVVVEYWTNGESYEKHKETTTNLGVFATKEAAQVAIDRAKISWKHHVLNDPTKNDVDISEDYSETYLDVFDHKVEESGNILALRGQFENEFLHWDIEKWNIK